MQCGGSNSQFKDAIAIGRDLELKTLEHKGKQMIPTIEVHVPG